MTEPLAILRATDASGETWTFEIWTSRVSSISNTRTGTVATLNPIVIRALFCAGNSASARARHIVDTFNLMVLTATKQNLSDSVQHRAAMQLARRISAQGSSRATHATRSRPSRTTAFEGRGPLAPVRAGRSVQNYATSSVCEVDVQG